MWKLDHKEGWEPKNWCFWTVVLEKTLESPLNCKEKKPVNSKGKQSWIFIGRIDAKVEVPILWHLTQRADSWKDPDAGKYWRQEEKAMREDEIVGWQHKLSGHEFEPALGDSEGHRSLASFSSWCHKVRPFWVTEQSSPTALCYGKSNPVLFSGQGESRILGCLSHWIPISGWEIKFKKSREDTMRTCHEINTISKGTLMAKNRNSGVEKNNLYLKTH